MSSIRDKLGLVKTEIPIDEIPSHTQEISDWLRLRYLNETNQNSYVLTAFDWIEESVPQKYKLQQINTNVDISSKVEKEILLDNISKFVEIRICCFSNGALLEVTFEAPGERNI